MLFFIPIVIFFTILEINKKNYALFFEDSKINLLDQKKLFGYESQKEFYHLTDLNVFKKLKDL